MFDTQYLNVEILRLCYRWRPTSVVEMGQIPCSRERRAISSFKSNCFVFIRK